MLGYKNTQATIYFESDTHLHTTIIEAMSDYWAQNILH